MDNAGHRVSSLTPSQRALLEKRVRGIQVFPRAEPIARRAVEGSHPLSFAQRRLWFLHVLDPRTPLYNVPRAYRLAGPLDAAALRRALGAVEERHAVLRARFAEHAGEPRQVVGAAGAARLPLVDLGGVPDELREREAWRRAGEAAARPFDLARETPLRAWLFRLGAEDHLLLLSLHHVAADEWSVRVLARDLSRAYAAAVSGRAADLPALAVQYADWAAWERERLDDAALAPHLAWWRERMAGAAPLDLPADRPRPPVRSHRGAVHPFRLPAGLRESCAALARECRVTPFAVLLAAFQALLHRYTSADDLVVGTPSAARTRPELEELVGFFVNTLPIRVGLSGDPSFRELLRRAGEAAAGAMAHQEVPFDRLVEEVRPDRDPARAPLVQVVFAFQNVPGEPLALPGVRVDATEVDTGTAKFDLTLFVYEDGAGLRGRLEYAADLFDPATAARFAERFARVLCAALAAPDRPVAALPLLDAAERRHLVRGTNATARPYPRDATLPGLFEERAAASPHAVALEHGATRLTYAELDARANRLAHLLVEAGVEPGDRVGLLMERSAGMVTAMLATVKAGGVYVPLDPSHPPERIRALVEDAAMRVLLAIGAAAPADLPAAVRVLDPSSEAAGRMPPHAPERRCRAEAPAYVIYTSGSTGTPKGVAVAHRGVVSLALAEDAVRLAPGDAVAHLANPAFDAATWEVWGALLNGARLVVLDREVALAPARLRAALREHGVSAAVLTTALFNTVAREAPDAFATLRAVLFGGEAADAQAVRRVLRGGAPERLVNIYGPTEATVFATCHRVAEPPEEAASVSIGLPVANARAYVLDPGLEPVPADLPGELYLGGDGVALGYAGRAALTAERFLPDPFADRAGARMYRTGDRVRRRADGALEFLGRGDAQVKVRGFRIEPGEVEAVLAACPGVGEVVVAVREDEPGERRLVAYATPAALDAEAVRRFARGRLPDYMVPAAVVPLAALPLTPNGKVDRRALPAPGLPAPAARPATPRDMLEHQVAAIWEDVLGVRPVGIRDNFFALGGHSLLAARMMGRVEERFGKRVPLSVLFDAATVEALAAALRREWPAGEAEPIVTLNAGGSRPPLFFLHGDVGGGGLYGLALARFLGEDQPLHLLPPLRPAPDGAGPGIREMARAHLEVIRGAQPRGPYRLGGYCNGGQVAFEVARLLEAAGERVDRLLVVQASAESAYYAGPLRAAGLLLRAGGGTAAERLDRLAGVSDHLRAFHRELREHALRGVPGLAAMARVKLARRVRLLSRPGTGAAAEPSPPEPCPEPGDGARAARMRHMRGAVRGWGPGKYGGRVTLFWTQATLPIAWDPTVGWRRVAGEVEVVPIPGTHDSCVSVHLEALAQGMAACLRGD